MRVLQSCGAIGSVVVATSVTVFEDKGWAEQKCSCANCQSDGIPQNKIILVRKINST